MIAGLFAIAPNQGCGKKHKGNDGLSASPPYQISSPLDLVDQPTLMTQSGDYGAVYLQNNGFAMISLKVPTTPVVVGHLPWQGAITALAMSDQALFALDQNKGLVVLDTRDPTAPQVIAQLPLAELDDYAHSLIYDDSEGKPRLYLAGHLQGLVTIDVSQPRLPQRIITPSPSTRTFYNTMLSHHGHVVASAYADGIAIHKPEDGAGLTEVTWLHLDGHINRMTAADATLYLANMEQGLMVLDVSTLEHPQLRATYPTAMLLRDIVLIGQHVLLLSYNDKKSYTLEVVDVSDTAAIRSISRQTYTGHILSLHQRDNVVYMLDGEKGLTVLQLGDL